MNGEGSSDHRLAAITRRGTPPFAQELLREPGIREALAPLTVFAMLLSTKVLWILPSLAGPVISDEVLYARFARGFAAGVGYESAHFPPLYPLALSPAFASETGYFAFMKLLDAVYSSSIVIFVYLLARELMPRRAAVTVTVASAFVPFHFTLSTSSMSENLFIPLLIGAIWLVVRRTPRGVDPLPFLTGMTCSLLPLTRHVGIVAVPVLLVAWWMREREHAPDGRPQRAALLVAGLVLPLATWLIAKVAVEGLPVSEALGLGIANDPDPTQLTPSRLAAFAGAYAGYFALVAAPYLSLLAHALARAWRTRWEGPAGRYAAVWSGLTLTMGAALVRHSWRAAYNFPDIERIMGRYVVPFSVLSLIAAAATLASTLGEGARQRPARPWGSLAVHAGIVTAAGVVFLSDAVIALPDGFVTDRGAVDVYRLVVAGWPAIVLALAVAVYAVVAASRDWSATPALAGFTALVIAWSLMGLPGYRAELDTHQVMAEHTRQIAEYALGEPRVNTLVFVDDAVVEAAGVDRDGPWAGIAHAGLRFWRAERAEAEPTSWEGPIHPDTRVATLLAEEAGGPSGPAVGGWTYRLMGTHYAIVPGRAAGPQMASSPSSEDGSAEAGISADAGQGPGNADVVHVRASLDADGTWTFAVTVTHPDTGWDDYADGWDVVAPDGTVLGRPPTDERTRVLLHPHIDEQPFTRSRSGISIPGGVDAVTVRAHDSADGFGGREVRVDLAVESGDGFEVDR